MAIRDSRGAWPFPTIDEASRAGDWTEISDEHADDMLNALPPIYIPGGFMLGEAQYWANGSEHYTAVILLKDGRHLARHWPYSTRRNACADAVAAASGVKA